MNHENKSKLIRSPITYIIGAGFALRLLYVLFSTIYERQYDIGAIDLDAGHTVSGGHLAYIQYLYENLRLPDVDPTTVYQFHHPPLHHAISALWMHIVGIFVKSSDVIEESMQFVPFVCSIVILIIASKLLTQLGIKGRAHDLVMVIVAFHPALILLSGSVNNDCMALMFTLLCIYRALEWYRERTMKNICLTALWLGLGMSTKQNVAELALPLGLMFLIVLIQTIRQKDNIRQPIIQYMTFLAISVPTGMWFYVRNLVKYDMSMLWVYELSEDSWQYTGNVPVINRFLWPVPAEMLENIKSFKIGCGYNVWMQLMRTSVLGEWDMGSVGRIIKLVAVLLMLAGAILAISAFIGYVRGFVFGTKFKEYRVFYTAAYLTTMVCYLIFAYNYPQECSMNFRYIEVALFLQSPGLAVLFDEVKSKAFKVSFYTVLGGFAILSVIMCGVWCLQ